MGAIPEQQIMSEIRDETTQEMEREKFVQLATKKRVLCYVLQMFRMAKERGKLVVGAYKYL